MASVCLKASVLSFVVVLICLIVLWTHCFFYVCDLLVVLAVLLVVSG